MEGSRIIATGSYLPDNIVTNEEISKFVDTSDEWIVSRTGIKTRRIASLQDTAASMATEAAQVALTQAQLKPSDIQGIVLATCTGDYIIPSTACVVQKNLGMPEGIAFDVQAACSGFCYALKMADLLIKANDAQRILVIGTEVLTRLLDWTDRTTCVLFADGAGAVILEKSHQEGLIDALIRADGRYSEQLYVPNLACSNHETITSPYLKMQGKDVFKLAVTKGQEIVREILAKNNFTIEDVDWIIPHQANIRIIDALAEDLGFPRDKIAMTLDNQGNTSAASVPLALDHLCQQGRVQRGQLILMVAFGSGFTWASNLFRF